MAEPNATTNAALAGGAERVTVEKTAGDNDVTAALAHVGAIVADIAKMAGLPVPGAATAAAATSEDEVEKAKKGEKYTTMADMMKAAGLEGPALEAALEKAKKAGFDPNQKFPTAQPPVKKADEGAAGAPSMTAENVMDVVATSISKAKQFTPDRIEKLKAAQEILKLLIDSVEQGTNPGVSTPGGTSFGGSGVKGLTEPNDKPVIKSTDPEVLKALSDITTVLKGLTDKVAGLEAETASIKKARPASESLEEAGGTDTKTQKSSMWSGVL